MSKTHRKSSSGPRETAADIAASISAASLSVIRDEITTLSAAKGRARRHAIGRIAQLARQAAPIAAEHRKAEKAELAAIARLSPTVVMTWIRQQSPEYRARLVRDVAAIDGAARKSVLG
jgi:hypothetical protein